MNPSPAVPPPPTRVWLRFVRLHHRVAGEMGARLRAIGLSIPQFDVLSTLSEREGQSQRDLAERLYVTKGNVSGLVDRLVEAGFVERRAVAGDRRSHALFLTAAGRKAVENGLTVQAAFVGETLGQFDPADLGRLHELLGTWRDRIRTGSKP
jgi:DNA-binding MarR family transcriptional regulator